MLSKVLETVNKYKMIVPGDSVVVGLSGGADSVSLLISLISLKDRLGINKIIACHVNHNLRETAKRDEEFVRELCSEYGVDCFIKSVDIHSLKKELKVCEEDAGRIARYRFFHEIKEKFSATKIATAHNLNDQIETFFIRLLRGASLDGFASVKPVREDGVIRPLIEIKRESIESFLKEINQGFVTDETNFETDYLRNRIRLKLIPYLKENFEFKEDVITNTMRLFSIDSAFISKEVDAICDQGVFKEEEYVISLKDLKECDDAVLGRVIKKIAGDFFALSVSNKTIENTKKIIKDGKTGKEVPFSEKIYAFVSYDKFIVKKRVIINQYAYKLQEGDNVIKEAGVIFNLSTKTGDGKDCLRLTTKENLYVRCRKDGDRMYIKKVGHKKVKDIFIDTKIPREKRSLYPLVTNGDEIIWMPGLYKSEENRDGKYYLTIRRMENEE